MPKKVQITEFSPAGMLVKKVEGGYQVHYTGDGKDLQPVAAKVYFHPTSAYAAMGRIVHMQNLTALGIKTDPSKAPAKEKKEAAAK